MTKSLLALLKRLIFMAVLRVYGRFSALCTMPMLGLSGLM
jgi:hypothetical protein